MLSTRLTELLGIDHPVVLPGMSWISKAELVAAVSEAGGLGILATGPLQPDETREAIAQVRKRTSRPFGVGITLMMPGALHPDAKQAITEKTQDETIRNRNFDGMMARVMKTPTSLRITRRPMSFPETAFRAIRSARKLGMPIRQVLRALVTQLDRVRLLSYFGAALDKVEIATIRGDVENGVQFIGQAQGLVHDVPNAGDLVRRVVAEAEELLENLSKQSGPGGG